MCSARSPKVYISHVLTRCIDRNCTAIQYILFTHASKEHHNAVFLTFDKKHMSQLRVPMASPKFC